MPTAAGTKRARRRFQTILVGMTVLLLCSATAYVSLGSVRIPVTEVWGIVAHHLVSGAVATDWSVAHEQIVWELESFPGSKTLVLVNFRPGFSAGWMHHSYYRQVPLAPLRGKAVGEMLGGLLGVDLSLAPLLGSSRSALAATPSSSLQQARIDADDAIALSRQISGRPAETITVCEQALAEAREHRSGLFEEPSFLAHMARARLEETRSAPS